MRKTTLGSIAGGCAAAAVAITVAWPLPPQPVSAAAWTSAAARTGAPAGVQAVRVSGPDPFTGCAALPLDSGLPAGAAEPVVAVPVFTRCTGGTYAAGYVSVARP